MAKRAWSQWGTRFKREVDATSGLFALVGGGTATTGLVLAAPLVVALGGALVVGTAALCVVRSFPPKVQAPETIAGQRIEDLSVLAALDPKPLGIGIVGTSRAGKSTLVSHLQIVPAEDERTEKLYFMVVRLPGMQNYFALIDGAGQQYAQQFRVADAADKLIIFLDHADTSTGRAMSLDRRAEHERLLDQIASHLRVSGHHPSATHIVLNKRDLWQTAKQRREMSAWLDHQVEEWRRRVGGAVSFASHSNRNAADITAIVSTIRDWLK